MFLMYESAHGSDEISYRMLRTTDLQYNFASVRNIAQMQDPRTWFWKNYISIPLGLGKLAANSNINLYVQEPILYLILHAIWFHSNRM